MRSFTIVLFVSCLVALAVVEGCDYGDGTCAADQCCDNFIDGTCKAAPKAGDDCDVLCLCGTAGKCNLDTWKCE